MKTLKKLIKNETVFFIACILAAVSCFIVTPSKEYIKYVDFRTLGLLFSLMLVVQGLMSCGLFDRLVGRLLHTIRNTRQLARMLICLCFFSSMLITNDVALITFVPFTVILLGYADSSVYGIYLIVLETIAANLGSMFTPIGNPQNLYLYSLSNMDIAEFLSLMFPYTLVSLLLLLIATLFIKPKKLMPPSTGVSNNTLRFGHLFIYMILFVVCIATVLSLIDFKLMLVIVFVAVCVVDIKLLRRVDYILLLTFVAFFIFIGNLKNITFISDFLGSLVEGRECIVAIAASQVVSNVPAAMLLSGFTANYTGLIVGSNLGGLGTIIASMASLISFKFYAKTKESSTGKYMLYFSVLNIIFLGVLLIVHYIL